MKNQEDVSSNTYQPAIANYLVVIVKKGIPSEVLHCVTLEEAERTFGEIANDCGCEPEEINSSNRCHVSIWSWTENRYEDINYCP